MDISEQVTAPGPPGEDDKKIGVKLPPINTKSAFIP